MTRPWRAPAATVAAFALAGLLGCGKKGPPLPPLEGTIPRVKDLAISQVGEEAIATFTLPVRPGHFEADYATLGLELWRRPREPGAAAVAPPADDPRAPGIRPLPASGPSVDDFTKDATLAVAMTGEALFDVLAAPELRLVDRLDSAEADAPLEYALVLKTNVRKRGTLSNLVTLDPAPPLPPPTDITATAREGAVEILWTAPPEPAPPQPAPPPVPAGTAPAAPTGGEAAPAAPEGEGVAPPPPPPAPPALRYEIFRAVGSEPPSWGEAVEKGLSGTSWTDTEVDEGVTYTYGVRATQGAVSSATAASPPVTYRDTFAPRTPAGLRLVPEGSRAIGLIWNPNDEPDLGGYAVYRRRPGTEWQRIDPGGLRIATFTDTTVEAGPWEYSVASHDRASPPNESPRCEPRSVEVPPTVAP